MYQVPATQLVSLLATAAEKEQFDPNKVTPGVGGFLVIAVLAIALFFLGFDLVRRIRRANYRAEIHEELAAEIALAASGDSDASAGPASSPPKGGDPSAGGAADDTGATGSEPRAADDE